MKKLFFAVSILGWLFIASSCDRAPRDPEKARRRALAVAQKTFKKDARKVIDVTEYLPYSENGCVSYGNNGRYMIILRGSGLNPQGLQTTFRASLDVDMSGMTTKVQSIFIDLQSSKVRGE